MVEIREVNNKSEIRRFLRFPLALYKGNKYFVPPLYSDEKKLFKKNHVYAEQCETVYYNAYVDGKIQGRISGILQKASNDKWNQRRVRFTRFDCVNDVDVAKALFDAVEKWAISKGMDEVVGPLGFSDLEREGLLIEGFEYLSTFEEQYNYEYYKDLIEQCGYVKEVDWVERRIFPPKECDQRLKRLSAAMLKRYGLHMCEVKSTREFIQKYADAFFDILDSTYEHIYGTVPMTVAMRKMLVTNFKLLVKKEYVSVILDKDEKVVAFGVCFPSISEALQASGGRLTPSTLIRILKAIRKPKMIELGLVGVLPMYEGKGVSSALFAGIFDIFANNPSVEYAETNLNIEDNSKIINQWKNFDYIQHKRRRSFVKQIR